MTTHVVRTQRPEERELAAKRAELAELTAEVAQRELELATMEGELRAFEQRYLRMVGGAFVERDALEAQIAEAMNRLHPSDETRQHADEARARATESADARDAVDRAAQSDAFMPSDSLKALFREIAKRVHPDLATRDAERAMRTRMMADANRAYRKSDEARLRAILAEWETSPDTVPGEGTAAELVRTIRQIHQVRVRLDALAQEIAALRGSDLSVLKARVEAEERLGRDLLAQMANDLSLEIRDLRRHLSDLMAPEASS